MATAKASKSSAKIDRQRLMKAMASAFRKARFPARMRALMPRFARKLRAFTSKPRISASRVQRRSGSGQLYRCATGRLAMRIAMNNDDMPFWSIRFLRAGRKGNQ